MMGEWVPFDELTRLVLGYALRRHKVNTDVARLMSLWHEVEPFNDYTYLRNIMKSKSNARKLVALTNGTKESVRKLFARYDVLKDMEVYSEEYLRVYKPARRVYDLVKKKIGGEEEGEVYLVSSNSFDIIGAKNAGLKALYINRSNIAMDALGQ